MIIIDHTLAPSTIAGLGLFTRQPLAAGEVVYRFDARFTVVISNAELAALPPAVQARLANYVYRGKGAHRLADGVYYGTDDSRYMNHSSTPNTRWDEASETYVTTVALAANTELTCDYGEFCEPGDYCYQFAAT